LTAAEVLNRVEDVLGANIGKAGMSRDRTSRRPRISARGLLIAEQHRRDAIRRPPVRRHGGGEQRHHRRSHGRRKMGRPGVRHNHGPC
jgi:hypothetical protein